MARSCFFACASVENVPRFLRFWVFGFFLREYNRYFPDFSFLIMLYRVFANEVGSARWIAGTRFGCGTQTGRRRACAKICSNSETRVRASRRESPDPRLALSRLLRHVVVIDGDACRRDAHNPGVIIAAVPEPSTERDINVAVGKAESSALLLDGQFAVYI